MGRLLLLFIVLPAVELGLLIELGRRIGTLETLALIVVTGIVGASMARSQGLSLLSRVRKQIAAGEMPADSLLDGLMILIASALLVTPGVFTDAFGFLCTEQIACAQRRDSERAYASVGAGRRRKCKRTSQSCTNGYRNRFYYLLLRHFNLHF